MFCCSFNDECINNNEIPWCFRSFLHIERRGVGGTPKDNEKAMLGVEVSVAECRQLTALLCVSDVLMELIKKARDNKVDVDELLYD